MHLQTTTKLEITPTERERLEASLSTACGSYIQSVGKTDFADWSEADWNRFISTALDVAAVGIFGMRVVILGPSQHMGEAKAPF